MTIIHNIMEFMINRWRLTLWLVASAPALSAGAAPASWTSAERQAFTVCWDAPGFPEEKSWVQDVVEREYGHRGFLNAVSWRDCSEAPEALLHISIFDQGAHTLALGRNLAQRTHGLVLNFTFRHWSRSCQTNPKACIEGIAVHEFGHVLGLRDALISHPDDPASCGGQSLKHTTEDEDDGGTSVADHDSVMNYCNPSWRGAVLSAGDVAVLKEILGD